MFLTMSQGIVREFDLRIGYEPYNKWMDLINIPSLCEVIALYLIIMLNIITAAKHHSIRSEPNAETKKES